MKIVESYKKLNEEEKNEYKKWMVMSVGLSFIPDICSLGIDLMKLNKVSFKSIWILLCSWVNSGDLMMTAAMLVLTSCLVAYEVDKTHLTENISMFYPLSQIFFCGMSYGICQKNNVILPEVYVVINVFTVVGAVLSTLSLQMSCINAMKTEKEATSSSQGGGSKCDMDADSSNCNMDVDSNYDVENSIK